MPTGYTADLTDHTTLAEFAMRCARAFGALVSMRDEPFDAAIPDEFAPPTHHAKQIADAIALIEHVSAMTDTEAAFEAAAAHREAVDAYERFVARRLALATRYQRMIDQVEGWRPPSRDHVELKTFMLAQLRESKQFDCDGYEPEKPVALSGFAWRSLELERAQRDLANIREYQARDLAETAKRNAWVRALRESLKPKTPA